MFINPTSRIVFHRQHPRYTDSFHCWSKYLATTTCATIYARRVACVRCLWVWLMNVCSTSVVVSWWSLRLDHHVNLLHVVPGGIAHAEPDRADGGWTPDGAHSIPPASSEWIGTVEKRCRVVIVSGCREVHSVLRHRHKRVNISEKVEHCTSNTIHVTSTTSFSIFVKNLTTKSQGRFYVVAGGHVLPVDSLVAPRPKVKS